MKLETVGTVPMLVPEFAPELAPELVQGLVPELVPKLVPVPVLRLGTEPGAVLELEMEAETEQGNKNFALRP